MGQMIKAKLEEADYLHAHYLNYRWTTKKTIWVFGSTIVSSVFSGLLWHFGPKLLAVAVVFPLLGALIGDSVSRYIYVPWKARRVFRQQKSLRREFTLAWSEQGVYSKDSNGEYSSSWGDFLDWKESDQLFLVYISDINFYMIPKRAFADKAGLEDFRNYLVANIHT